VKFFFQIFLGYHSSTSNLEHACENLGVLGPRPLVCEEIENAQTVHKPKLKFIYIYIYIKALSNEMAANLGLGAISFDKAFRSY
jgi:hypothetical protein